MTDMGDTFRAMREESRERRWAKSSDAIREYEDAKHFAEDAGMQLLECVEGVHYRLLVPQERGNWKQTWQYDIWPSTGRIRRDPNHAGPFLPMEQGAWWGLIEVVRAAIEAQKKVR